MAAMSMPGDDVARREGVEHAVVPHGYAVVDGDGVELSGIAAEVFYLFLYDLPYLVEVCMSGNELSERVDHSDDGLSELFALHAVGYPQGTRTCHASAFGAD